MTDDAMRASLRAGLADCTDRFARQIDEAPDLRALSEIADRLSAMSNLLTPPPDGHRWRVVAAVT